MCTTGTACDLFGMTWHCTACELSVKYESHLVIQLSHMVLNVSQLVLHGSYFLVLVL